MIETPPSTPVQHPCDGEAWILRVGVLVSGNGTNLQALLDAQAAGVLGARVVVVGCNRADARALERARAAGVAVCLADRTQIRKRIERQALLRAALLEARVDLVVLAGFDEILTPELVSTFAGRIVNTHPSLLPAFGGTMHAVRAALEHGVKVSGCTVHLVTDKLDGGPILDQRAVPVLDGDTEETLHRRILEQEHLLLPLTVRAFAEGRLALPRPAVYVSA